MALAWNVIATTYDHEYRAARRLLADFGEVSETAYRNVLVMQVDDTGSLLDRVQQKLASDAALGNAVARLVPVETSFRFDTPGEFEARAREAVRAWLPRLGSSKFHVRMHRRGFKGRISSQQEEQFLDHFLLECLAARGEPGEIDFDDPDFVIALETLGNEAGLSCWTRAQLRSYELLRLD